MHAGEARLGENQLRREADADGRDQRDHQRLDVAETFVLQIKHGEHIQRGDDATPDQRDAEEQLQARWPSRRPRPDRRRQSRFRKESRETKRSASNNDRGRPAPDRVPWRRRA